MVNTLRDRISIVEIVKTTSLSGAPEKAERVLKTCRANHKQTDVKEEEDGKVRALFSDVFIIRYDKSLTKGRATAMFVKDNEDYSYNIISVVPIVPKKYLQINTVRRE